jgi:hypothetical protein
MVYDAGVLPEPEKIRVLVYEPGKPGEVRDVPNELRSYQRIVGGYIEVIQLHADAPGLLVVCNEDGCRLNLAPNRGLVGAFFVVRQAGAEFASLTPVDERVARRLIGL